MDMRGSSVMPGKVRIWPCPPQPRFIDDQAEAGGEGSACPLAIRKHFLNHGILSVKSEHHGSVSGHVRGEAGRRLSVPVTGLGRFQLLPCVPSSTFSLELRGMGWGELGCLKQIQDTQSFHL